MTGQAVGTCTMVWSGSSVRVLVVLLLLLSIILCDELICVHQGCSHDVGGQLTEELGQSFPDFRIIVHPHPQALVSRRTGSGPGLCV